MVNADYVLLVNHTRKVVFFLTGNQLLSARSQGAVISSSSFLCFPYNCSLTEGSVSWHSSLLQEGGGGNPDELISTARAEVDRLASLNMRVFWFFFFNGRVTGSIWSLLIPKKSRIWPSGEMVACSSVSYEYNDRAGFTALLGYGKLSLNPQCPH